VNFDSIAEMGRRMKAEVVALYGNDADEERSDLRNFTVCVRQGENAFLLEVGSGVDAVRQTCFWSAALIPCDEVYLVADGRFKNVELKDWDDPNFVEPEKGEFQREWEAGRRQGLNEGLMISRFPYIGNPSLRVYPYKRKGTKLTWDTGDPGGQIAGGAVPNFAADGFRARREHSDEMWQIMHDMGDSMDLDRERQQYHMDRAMARLVSEKDGVYRVAVLEDGSTFMDGKEIDG
jgi:hypothetical protein